MDFMLWIWNLSSQAQVAQNNWGSLFLPVEHTIIPMQDRLRVIFNELQCQNIEWTPRIHSD